MTPEELAAIKAHLDDVFVWDGHHESTIEHARALVEEVERLRRVEAALRSERPEWIVNDGAELGVMVHGRAFFLYKGRSLEYGDATHDDGTPMMYRSVGKREFGECCHPVVMKSMPDRYAVPLQEWNMDDGNPRVVDLPNGGWMPLPVNDAALRAAGSGD